MADDIAAARPKALGDSANPGTDTRRRRLAVPVIETSRGESWPLPD
jgi:hypothetical protein